MRPRLLMPTVVLAIALGAVGCDSGTDPTPLPFATLAGTECLELDTPGTAVLVDAGGWVAYWADHAVCDAPPVVDFGQDMLVVVHWGTGYTGCTPTPDAVRTVLRHETYDEVIVGALGDLGDCTTPVRPLQVVRFEWRAAPVIVTGQPLN